MPIFNEEELIDIQVLDRVLSKKLDGVDKLGLSEIQIYLGQIYKYTEARKEDWESTEDSLFRSGDEANNKIMSNINAYQARLQGMITELNLKSEEKIYKSYEFKSKQNLHVKDIAYERYLSLENQTLISKGEYLEMVDALCAKVEPELNEMILESQKDKKTYIPTKTEQDEIEKNALNDVNNDEEYKQAKSSYEQKKGELNTQYNLLSGVEKSSFKEKMDFILLEEEESFGKMFTNKLRARIEELTKERGLLEAEKVEAAWINKINEKTQEVNRKVASVLDDSIKKLSEAKKQERDKKSANFLKELESEKKFITQKPQEIVLDGEELKAEANIQDKVESEPIVQPVEKSDSVEKESAAKIGKSQKPKPKAKVEESLDNSNDEALIKEENYYAKLGQVKEPEYKRITNKHELLEEIDRLAMMDNVNKQLLGQASGGFVDTAKGTTEIYSNMNGYKQIWNRELVALKGTFKQDQDELRVAQGQHIDKIRAIHNLLKTTSKTGFTSNSTEYSTLLTKLDSFEKQFKEKGWAELLKPEKQDISKLNEEEKKSRKEMLDALGEVYDAGKDYMVAKGPQKKYWKHGRIRYELSFLLCSEIYTFGGHAAEVESRIAAIDKDISNNVSRPKQFVKQIPDRINASEEFSEKYKDAINAEIAKNRSKENANVQKEDVLNNSNNNIIENNNIIQKNI
ncbi:hypothetical protein SAMN02910298_02568 [Pseudobutyrivibrio sp. YE44]|uniref:hypothetical protein n=1 Tax=Pseudobutyrivibrio sp. YE44 TaxID=1520802 RepID=UPI00088C9AE5|nr:hypothetical protein [Pseudobutyrivibrio sp. YE44]SDB50611.1 hypothetical protein SAMN02910298_02568 [Pseudobutyrivibrio sp. YE44]